MAKGSLEGKVALVTGASRGIGRAVAVELARCGARIAINYRTGQTEALAVAEEVAAIHRHLIMASNDGEERVLAVGTGARVGAPAAVASLGQDVMLVPTNVGDGEEVRAMVQRIVERWGRLDILVNNAGITRDRTLRKLNDDDWLAVINNNLNSVFYCTSAAVPLMSQQGYGRIVNVGSLIAQAGAIGQANYAAAKGGIAAFTKTAALELARFNITVNVVVPGYTATDMFANVPDAIQDQIKARIPMARFAKPEEIAKAVRFLVVDGDYITGQQLNVNGGLYM